MALLEAAACSLPTVATDVAGTREAVIPGETAWLTPPSAPDALAHTMSALMRVSPQARAAMGGRARRHVLRHFDIEMILDRWEELYRSSRTRTEDAIGARGAFSPAS